MLRVSGEPVKLYRWREFAELFLGARAVELAR